MTPEDMSAMLRAMMARDQDQCPFDTLMAMSDPAAVIFEWAYLNGALAGIELQRELQRPVERELAEIRKLMG